MNAKNAVRYIVGLITDYKVSGEVQQYAASNQALGLPASALEGDLINSLQLHHVAGQEMVSGSDFDNALAVVDWDQVVERLG